MKGYGMNKYPVNLTVDYSGISDRFTAFFRPVLTIPILIILILLVAPGWGTHDSADHSHAGILGGIIFVPALLMIVFRRKYPRWWFDWNMEFVKFSLRVTAYLLLLRDEYPATDSEQSIHLDMAYPDMGRDLNQWLPLIKWFLVIPHVILLCPLIVGVILVTIVAWFMVLATENYPKALFDYVVGVLRWSTRVAAYSIILTTDEYPPFSLAE